MASFRWFLVLGLFACGESPRGYNVQHDVGRLCAAWVQCGGGDCAGRYGAEGGRMMSSWGKALAPELAGGEPDAIAKLAAMSVESGAEAMSADCRALTSSLKSR